MIYEADLLASQEQEVGLLYLDGVNHTVLSWIFYVENTEIS